MSRPRVVRRAGRALRGLWRFLREASGDAAYETYVHRAAPGPRLTREEFYLDGLRRRYERAGRCC